MLNKKKMMIETNTSQNFHIARITHTVKSYSFSHATKIHLGVENTQVLMNPHSYIFIRNQLIVNRYL